MDWLVDCETLTEAETLRVKLVENNQSLHLAFRNLALL